MVNGWFRNGNTDYAPVRELEEGDEAVYAAGIMIYAVRETTTAGRSAWPCLPAGAA
jgi:hypothetical protein